MGETRDRLGDLLVRAGILDDAAVQDLIKQQKRTLPLASMAYVLGYAEETPLVRGLAMQVGLPGVVFEASRIDLSLLDDFESSWLSHHGILPVYRDGRRLFLAVSDPKQVKRLTRQIEFDHDVTLVIHVALHVALARAIRKCAEARERGQRYLIGFGAEPDQDGPEVVVATTLQPEDEDRVAGPVSVRHETSDWEFEDLVSRTTGIGALVDDDFDEATNLLPKPTGNESSYDRAVTQLDLDASMDLSVNEGGRQRILVVDDDPASRDLLVHKLLKEGYDLLTSSGGRRTLDVLRENVLSAVIIDAMNPNIDGFQICRAIKRSRRYGHTPVILMSELLGTGDISDKVVRQYGADAYFGKPVNLPALTKRLAQLVANVDAETDELSILDDTFEGAMESFRAGRVAEAIEQLRLGIEDDPLSPKHHFLLANLLHGEGNTYEAIDEYETVVDLCPDYFPALTRLAYLYYEKGYSAKAVDTWRRSLPHCESQEMRTNIEGFMRKLISTMQSEAGA